jgi:hypothetical protein
MFWRITITHFTPHETPQTRQEKKQVEAPTATDAITICNLRYKLPWEGRNGTANAHDYSVITDIEPYPSWD